MVSLYVWFYQGRLRLCRPCFYLGRVLAEVEANPILSASGKKVPSQPCPALIEGIFDGVI